MLFDLIYLNPLSKIVVSKIKFTNLRVFLSYHHSLVNVLANSVHDLQSAGCRMSRPMKLIVSWLGERRKHDRITHARRRMLLATHPLAIVLSRHMTHHPSSHSLTHANLSTDPGRRRLRHLQSHAGHGRTCVRVLSERGVPLPEELRTHCQDSQWPCTRGQPHLDPSKANRHRRDQPSQPPARPCCR